MRPSNPHLLRPPPMARWKMRHGFRCSCHLLPTRTGPTSCLGGVLQMDRDAALGIAVEIAYARKCVVSAFPCETTQTLVGVTRVPHEHSSTHSLALTMCPHVPSYAFVPARLSVSTSAPNVSVQSVGVGHIRHGRVKLAIAADGALQNKHRVACDHGAHAPSLQR